MDRVDGVLCTVLNQAVLGLQSNVINDDGGVRNLVGCRATLTPFSSLPAVGATSSIKKHPVRLIYLTRVTLMLGPPSISYLHLVFLLPNTSADHRSLRYSGKVKELVLEKLGQAFERIVFNSGVDVAESRLVRVVGD